jgi:Spy/CpxP family protein refolding chaperone
MKIRNIILTIAALALVLAPAAASAQRGPGSGHGGSSFRGFGGPGGGHGLEFAERMLPRMAERLGLSDEQLAAIESILDEAQPTIDDYAEQLREGRESYREAIDDPTVFDEGAFRAHLAAQNDIQVELAVTVAEARAKIFGALTQEQRDQLEEMRANRWDKSSRRGGGRWSDN